MTSTSTKIKYKEISSFEFQSVVQKIANTPTGGKSACHIRHITKEISEARDRISDEFRRDIMEVFGEKDENGALKRPDHQPNGFTPVADRIEEFKKAQDAFAEREVELKWRKLTPSCLADVKLSGAEMNTIWPIFSEDEGPGVPHMHSVK